MKHKKFWEYGRKAKNIISSCLCEAKKVLRRAESYWLVSVGFRMDGEDKYTENNAAWCFNQLTMARVSGPFEKSIWQLKPATFSTKHNGTQLCESTIKNRGFVEGIAVLCMKRRCDEPHDLLIDSKQDRYSYLRQSTRSFILLTAILKLVLVLEFIHQQKAKRTNCKISITD